MLELQKEYIIKSISFVVEKYFGCSSILAAESAVCLANKLHDILSSDQTLARYFISFENRATTLDMR